MSGPTWTEITAEERAAVCEELEGEAKVADLVVRLPSTLPETRAYHEREAAIFRAAVAFLTSGAEEIARLKAQLAEEQYRAYEAVIEAEQKAREAEREACAEIAEMCSGGDHETPARAVIASRIRGRGAR